MGITHKCSRCHIHKEITESHFSIENLKLLAKNPRITIPCKNCSGQSPDEKECTYCDKVKPLDKFSKQGRRKADPECWDCTKKRIAIEPDEATAPLDSDSDPGSDDGDDSDASYESTTKSMASTTISGSTYASRWPSSNREGVPVPSSAACSSHEGSTSRGGISIPSSTSTFVRSGMPVRAAASSVSTLSAATDNTSRVAGRPSSSNASSTVSSRGRFVNGRYIPAGSPIETPSYTPSVTSRPTVLGGRWVKPPKGQSKGTGQRTGLTDDEDDRDD